MEISSPRRVLAVSLADEGHHLARVIKDLTGTYPKQDPAALAGSTHDLSLKTAYYTAEVPIWLDLVSSPTEWAGTFLSVDAKEVLEVLGGVIVVFLLPVKSQSDETKAARELIQSVGKVVKDGLGGWSWDGVSLCLGIGEIDDVDEWEDCCAEWGLEFVQVKSQSVATRNEFGEKTGIPRALEALEANDWVLGLTDDLEHEDYEAEGRTGTDGTSKDADGPDLDPESLDFGFDREDFAGLKQAILNAGKEDDDFLNGEPSTDSGKKDDGESIDDEDIKKLERMMVKLQAVRDTSAGMPEEQRKRIAAKAVAEVMKEL
ncbi:hypothetical protein K445DRAFT_315021 [Daldinia sp. EC12]|nr:hypothetical protein K445DRAFT_315021 [Daldinia sp. EC12]